jgi:hypothetical protein
MQELVNSLEALVRFGEIFGRGLIAVAVIGGVIGIFFCLLSVSFPRAPARRHR